MKDSRSIRSNDVNRLNVLSRWRACSLKTGNVLLAYNDGLKVLLRMTKRDAKYIMNSEKIRIIVMCMVRVSHHPAYGIDKIWNEQLRHLICTWTN